MEDFTLPAWPGEQLESIGIVLLAAVLAGLIGLEREKAEKPAGFRTHMLVGAAAALLVVLGRVLAQSYMTLDTLQPNLRIDPLRTIEAIIVGISFIGAGTILKVAAEDRVRYLTTAASILLSAGVGIAVALHQFYLATGVVITVLAITQLMSWFERRLPAGDRDH